eukprot:4392502-Pleurochrysis_carterae.AAC.1
MHSHGSRKSQSSIFANARDPPSRRTRMRPRTECACESMTVCSLHAAQALVLRFDTPFTVSVEGQRPPFGRALLQSISPEHRGSC